MIRPVSTELAVSESENQTRTQSGPRTRLKITVRIKVLMLTYFNKQHYHMQTQGGSTGVRDYFRVPPRRSAPVSEAFSGRWMERIHTGGAGSVDGSIHYRSDSFRF